MSEAIDAVLGKWRVTIPPQGEVSIQTLEGEPIATIHGPREVQLRRALLMARAPALREAAVVALQIFRYMLNHEDERVRGSAEDLIPVLESALYLTEPA